MKKKKRKQKTVYIIKPDCLKYRQKIKSIMLLAGLKIVSCKIVKLTARMVDIVYGELSDEIRRETRSYLCGKEVEIGVVSGAEAVRRLVKISGFYTNPKKFEPGTIRYRFAHQRSKKLNSGFIFQYNGFHRSRDKAEVSRDLKVFNMAQPEF